MPFPDCRNDAHYNEDFLDEKGKTEVLGYDQCASMADNFFDNMDTYFKGDSYLMHILNENVPENMKESYEVVDPVDDSTKERTVGTYADYLRMCLRDYIESHRDELITSLIDKMDDETFSSLRRKVLNENKLSENPKVYYDTRSFKHHAEPVEE